MPTPPNQRSMRRTDALESADSVLERAVLSVEEGLRFLDRYHDLDPVPSTTWADVACVEPGLD